MSKTFKPHRDKVFVTDMERGERQTKGGIIITDDNMKDTGIRSRWGQVFAVGDNIKDVVPGDWLLMEHGRWSFGIDIETPEGEVRVWHVDFPEGVLLWADSDPRSDKFKN